MKAPRGCPTKNSPHFDHFTRADRRFSFPDDFNPFTDDVSWSRYADMLTRSSNLLLLQSLEAMQNHTAPFLPWDRLDAATVGEEVATWNNEIIRRITLCLEAELDGRGYRRKPQAGESR